MARIALTALASLLMAMPVHSSMPEATPEVIDHVVVDKSARTIALYAGGAPVRAITGIQLGDAPVGHKRFQGDERTPEGRYLIDYGNPASSYHLSLHISYPNADDESRARAAGRQPGGAIFIHGQPNGMAGRMRGDWTDGCIALANDEIEYLWERVPNGTVIDILP
jgi:murein L,D-transpeptidase YafK